MHYTPAAESAAKSRASARRLGRRRRRIPDPAERIWPRGTPEARALDGVTIEVTPPADDRIGFLARLETLDITPGAAAAKAAFAQR